MVAGAPFLRVVQRLRSLVQQWWGLDMAFVDAHGKLHFAAAGPHLPPICAAAHATRAGAHRCIREELTFAREARAAGGEAIATRACHAGLLRLYAPIHVEGQFIGAILVAGYRTTFPDGPEWARIVTALDALGIGEAAIASVYERARLLDARDEGYLTSLLQLVTQEIADYEQELMTHNRRHFQGTGADPFAEIVGRSPAIRRVLMLVAGVAASDATILVTGESGTGKERIARALHARSARSERPFVALNCGALQDQLLESELFGHVRGSFTGAVRDKAGLLRQADGGTLLLDEVGEMSLAMQVKLLRVLQEGVFYPVGGTATESVDVRIVAATHRNLETMVAEGRFREDLYYRLNVIRVDVPPLRERRDDIPLLVEHFLARRGDGGAAKRLHPATLQALMRYPWPGNVRELENELARLCVLTGDAELIAPALLSERIREPEAGAAEPAGTLEAAVEALERRLIAEGLRRTNWNKSLLSRELGMSRTSLIQKIERYGLERRKRVRKAA